MTWEQYIRNNYGCGWTFERGVGSVGNQAALFEDVDMSYACGIPWKSKHIPDSNKLYKNRNNSEIIPLAQKCPPISYGTRCGDGTRDGEDVSYDYGKTISFLHLTYHRDYNVTTKISTITGFRDKVGFLSLLNLKITDEICVSYNTTYRVTDIINYGQGITLYEITNTNITNEIHYFYAKEMVELLNTGKLPQIPEDEKIKYIL